jgi:hypothetical protein
MPPTAVLDASYSMAAVWELVRKAYSDLISDSAIVPHNAPGGDDLVAEGIEEATDSIVNSGITPCPLGGYPPRHQRMIHLMPEAMGVWQRIEQARDAAMNAGIAQINAVGLADPNPGFNRAYLVEHAAAPIDVLHHPDPPPFAFVNWVAAGWRGDPNMLYAGLASTLWRVSRCPADFNGDGVVNSDDYDAFEAAWLAASSTADWDMSGGLPDAHDWAFFLYCYTVLSPCPCE